MNDDDGNILITLLAVFAPFSLMSIGGGSAIIPGLQRTAVELRGWITPDQFIEMFAVARAAPGPGTMLSTLIGYEVAGWAGAMAATIGLMVPSAILCWLVFRLSNRHRDKKWNRALRRGLAPVGVGLTIAGGITIFRLSGGTAIGAVLTAASTAIMLWRPSVPVILLLAGGAGVMLALQTLG